MANVSLQSIRKAYGAQTVVHDLDLEVNDRDFIVLVGPSGCGKSTTLRMVAGLEEVSAGKLLINGRDVTSTPPQQRDIAMVFQSYALYPHMTAYMNMAFGLMKTTRLDKREIDARVREAAAILHIEDLLQRKPNELSGGQRQRVAIGRALVRKPSVFLFDEPLSNLDALLREQMRVEIRRIQTSLGITAVYVTHDRVEAMSLSDRVIVMKDGRIRQIGSPNDIYERPDSAFVAGFVGKVAFFPVEIQGADGQSCACSLRGKAFRAGSTAPGVAPGSQALLMARPESLRLGPPDSGIVDGTVRQNVYLGSSVESFVTTEYGELLVQIDDPAGKRLAAEGERVSVSFNEDRVRVLPASLD